jgi:arabinose-5-phosphate isomerase
VEKCLNAVPRNGKPERFDQALIADFMTPSPQFVYDDVFAAELLKIFEKKHIDDLPVCDRSGRVVGLVDIQDLPKMKVL